MLLVDLFNPFVRHKREFWTIPPEYIYTLLIAMGDDSFPFGDIGAGRLRLTYRCSRIYIGWTTIRNKQSKYIRILVEDPRERDVNVAIWWSERSLLPAYYKRGKRWIERREPSFYHSDIDLYLYKGYKERYGRKSPVRLSKRWAYSWSVGSIFEKVRYKEEFGEMELWKSVWVIRIHGYAVPYYAVPYYPPRVYFAIIVKTPPFCD
jgi:hypothetical protein